MKFPKLPNNFVKSQATVMKFLGINQTENYQEGELSDGKNLSAHDFPVLTQRKARKKIDGYSTDITDIYQWNGKLITVSNGNLYVDGEMVTSVTNTKKEFAVVNTRLIVFPDKISVDLNNNEVKILDAAIETTGTAGGVIFGHNLVKAILYPKGTEGLTYGARGDTRKFKPFLYTYGSIDSVVKEAWNAETGEWDLTALEAVKAKRTTASLYAGITNQIFIPKKNGLSSFCPVFGDDAKSPATEPDTEDYNTEGYYCKVTGISGEVSTTYFYVSFKYTLYDIKNSQELFSDVFEVGDIIDITGSRYGILDTIPVNQSKASTDPYKSRKTITGITDMDGQYSQLSFADNSFRIPVATISKSTALPAKKPDGTFYTYVGRFSAKISATTKTYYIKTQLKKEIPKDMILTIMEIDAANMTCTMGVYNESDKEYTDMYTGLTVYEEDPSPSSYESLGTFSSYDPGDSTSVKFQRSVPDLDYICERDNRLWGVSNKDNTIYCSELGIPWSFYNYSGTEDQSYSVVVGSEGEFTGIVSYNGVLCFKENTLHKMLGSLPSEFYMTTYKIAGIQKGASRSAKTISEVLYYKSCQGVVAFTGYQPSVISAGIKFEDTEGAEAAADGRYYYICAKDKDSDRRVLYTYDSRNKVWQKEDEEYIDAMATVDGTVYLLKRSFKEMINEQEETILIPQGEIYATNQADSEEPGIEWFAQFVPFQEEASFNKKGYIRVLVRLNTTKGSHVKIRCRKDGGAWWTAWTQPASSKLVHTVPIKISRCDKFEIRIEGVGRVKLRGIQREFISGGWN